jgi:uncharacterized protein GlcG (DUF336 family)
LDPILKYAQSFCKTVIDHAERYSLNMTVLAVDQGGHLIALYRMDKTSFLTIEAARRKALAAASMQLPTSSMVHLFEDDPLVITAVHQGFGALVVPGGFPMIVDGNCRGGLGISGGHYNEDEMLGKKALEYLQKNPAELA